MNQLVPRSPSSVVPAGRDVHDAVRDQLVADLTPERLHALASWLDPATFNEALHWLSSAKRRSLDTKRGYADDLVRFTRWVSGQLGGQRPVPLLQVLTHEMLAVWSVYARSQEMAVRTQRRLLGALSSLFTYAGQHGWAIANPVSYEDHASPVGTSDNGRPVGATETISVTAVAKLRAACRDATDHLVFDLLYLHGLRESDVVRIRADNIDRAAGSNLLKVERKGGKWTERRLSDTTLSYLDAVLAGRTTGPLLIHKGAAWTRFKVIDLTRRLARHAELPNPNNLTPHVLRATAITELLNNGQPLAEVQKWADHALPMTTQAYWERSNAVQRDAVLTMDLANRLDTVDARNALPIDETSR
jgi:site-specific recombinase XerD